MGLQFVDESAKPRATFDPHASVVRRAATRTSCILGERRGLSGEEIAQDLQEVAERWLDNVTVSYSSEFWSFVVAGDFIRRGLEARDYEAYQASLRSLYPNLYTERPAS